MTRVRASQLTELLERVRADPTVTALLFDIDGTLAPIVADPEDAAVPETTRDILRALASRYALVACVTGRRALEARWIVGVEELLYSGNHGLELLRPGAAEAEVDPAIAQDARRARDFVLDLDAEEVSVAGLRLESKGPIQALHWRGVTDEAAAERQARRIAGFAERAGLSSHWGRKVLEIRPVDEIDKGTAAERLLAEPGVRIALFAGDDRGDLAAFAALDRLVRAGTLASAVRIGVLSEEGPPELGERADAVVEGPEGFIDVLNALAEPGR
jgi:trehalose 6-phosphate phosphatase